MAIDHISVGDVESISKINQAIDKANLVDDKADKSALLAEITARQDGLAGESAARISADNAEAVARAAGDASLQSELAAEVAARQVAVAAEAVERGSGDLARPTYAESVPSQWRPGDAARFFTSDLVTGAQPISDEWRIISASGAVIAIPGAGKVAPRPPCRIEPGHQYRIRVVFQRGTDTDDPANDAVRVGLQWLTKTKADGGMTVCADVLDVTVASGRLEFSFNIARENSDNIDFVAPSTAIYARPFVQAFGSGITHVEVVEIVDLSIAADWSPDVSTLQREIAGLRAQIESLNDRISTLET